LTPADAAMSEAALALGERQFDCLVLSPGEIEGSGLAVAAARAGGVGVLDLARCRPGELPDLERRLRTLIAQVSAEARIGLRLDSAQIAWASPLLDLLDGRPHWLILAGAPLRGAPGRHANRHILAEVLSVDEASAWSAMPGIDGLVAAGTEAGGWSGGPTGFILLQALLRQGNARVYVRGGVGEHGAAACRAGGGAGVVLDDQVLLMPESPLPDAWRVLISRADGTDSLMLGEHLDLRCRIFGHPSFIALKAMAARDSALEIAEGSLEERRALWRAEIGPRMRFEAPEKSIWPIGQSIGLAEGFRRRFRSTGRAVQAILNKTQDQIDLARRLAPLAADSPLAVSHGLRYPFVQGPMTRVSDNASFAKAVAGAGALPMLALGVMRGPQVETLLAETARSLGDLPWGSGVLGFMDPEVRKEQLAVVKKFKPPFAVVAGGRADIAEELESAGIRAYLHVPTVALLGSVIQRGLKRFVFEGRECGGHVGPLGSLALWEGMTEALLAQVPAKNAGDYHVLFAGGIHDARSGAMVSAFAARLAERGLKIGVLMGTAYLFTRESVEQGAVTAQFQNIALACRTTVLVESSPGQFNRCADTESCREFDRRRIDMRRRDTPPDNLRDALDTLLLGRLRLASKGLLRDVSGNLVAVDKARQHREGMYMLGEAATLRGEVTSLATLHEEIAHGAIAWLQQESATVLPAAPRSDPADIAVIGMELIVPGASNRQDFWVNLLRKVNAIGEYPKDRWDWSRYYDPEGKGADRVASRWGGFIEPQPFDPLRFGLPPNSLSEISAAQLASLEIARRALEDSGYNLADIDREHTAVVFGVGNTGGFSGDLFKFRSMLPLLLGGVPDSLIGILQEWTSESFPGHLDNVVSGRIANRFDLGGLNFGVDSACASSLAAIHVACRELATGQTSLAIVGGIEMSQIPATQLSFGKTGALSPTGSVRPFDAKADGIVVSEGGAVVVLKRRVDAERDGDRIYALIRGVAGSSDGKSMGMTAPRPLGQMRALDRAYDAAGLSPAAISLYEAHATGTAVGDRAELDAISTVLRRAGARPASCSIGSVKSLVGHTGSAAGMTSFIKTALALHYRTLPPHAGVDQPLEELGRTDSPLYLLDQPRPWLRGEEGPRHGAVSAFGFGGTNFHVVLEEYLGASRRPAAGGEAWPAELIVLSGRDQAELIAATQAAENLALREHVSLREVAHACARAHGRPRPGAVLATIVARDRSEFLRIATTLPKSLRESAANPGGQGLQFAVMPTQAPQLALLFPGQGAQSTNMMREAAVHVPDMRPALELADRILAENGGLRLDELIYPPRAFSPAERQAQQARLTDTAVAQPAIGALSIGLLGFLRRLGVRPAMVAGHSFGEWVALHAAGAFGEADLLRHSAERGRLMAGVSRDGAMAAILTSREVVERALPSGARTVVANHNSPSQTIISGPAVEIDELVATFSQQGIRAVRLAVAGAFHSPLMAEAQEALGRYIDNIEFGALRLPVYANADGAPYPEGGVGNRLKKHLLGSIEFVSQIRRMRADGADLFVEVGPGTALTNLVGEIFKDGDHREPRAQAIALDGMGAGLAGTLGAIAALWRGGVALDLVQLFQGRVDPAGDFATLSVPAPARGDWLMDGQRTWRKGRPAPVLNVPPPIFGPDAVIQPAAPSGVPVGLASPGGSGPTADVYATYQETMRQFLAAQERIVTTMLQGAGHAGDPSLPAGDIAAALRHMPQAAAKPPATPAAVPAARVEREAPREAAMAPPAAPEIEHLAPAAPIDREELTRLIVATAEKATGYPPDMLGVDAVVEAELGIGSIKRLEILEALAAQLPAVLARQLRAAMDRVVRVKTFAGWAEQIMSGDSGAGASGAPAPSTAAPRASADAPLRHVMRGDPKPLAAPGAAAKAGGMLLSEDDLGVAKKVQALLRQRGIASTVLSAAQMANPGELARSVAKFSEAGQNFGGILHLASLAQGPMPSTLDAWRRETERQGKSLLRLLRLLGGDLRADKDIGPGRVIAASMLGGQFGRSATIGLGSPASGAGVGAIATLHQEWPEVLCKSVDFDSSRSLDEIAGHIVDELLGSYADREIGYPQGRRTAFQAVAAPIFATPGRSLAIDKWVVLATGGARGITAEIAKDWARPGMRFVLVGRADPTAPEAVDMAALRDEGALRRYLIEQGRQGATLRHPASIELEIAAIMRRREIRRSLAALRERGAEVEYHAVSVLDAERFTGLIEDIYARYGRIDAVLHGAGAIEDKLIADKSDESIDRVFDTKADSAFLLYRALRADSLKTIVFFASVAGRFGNRGQSDYSAANELLNRLAWRMQAAWPATRVLAVNWGAWSDVGMAVGALDRRHGERLAKLNPAEGCRALREEIEVGAATDVEVIVGRIPGEESDRLPGSAPIPG
jgi:acyl transferase domain-containing protein/NAD(P)H-dependent flavin oxidoreductase YrpB (nitropropane dioxygenase family)/NAD(P)-dependent dehydrogenase (short-subunit alcohol dehydrogenase family)